MTAADVIAAHRLVGDTVFSHRGGSCFVDYPTCGCGEQMHTASHPQHLLNALAEAGFTVAAGSPQ